MLCFDLERGRWGNPGLSEVSLRVLQLALTAQVSTPKLPRDVTPLTIAAQKNGRFRSDIE